MVEAATSETLAFLVKLVKESLNETKHLRDSESGESKLLPLTTVTGEFRTYHNNISTEAHYVIIERELSDGNQDLRRLITLQVRVMLLSDIYSTAGYAQGRASTTLLQALTGSDAGELLQELGSLHRSCLWENILLKNADSPPELKTSETSGDDALHLNPFASASSSTVATVTPAATETNGTRNLPRPPFVVPSQSSSSDVAPSQGNPQSSNNKILQNVTGQLPNTSLLPLFQGMYQGYSDRSACTELFPQLWFGYSRRDGIRTRRRNRGSWRRPMWWQKSF